MFLRSLPWLLGFVGFAALSGSSHVHPRHTPYASLKTGKRADVPIPDPASRVNLFIGTTGPGHAFPGA